LQVRAFLLSERDIVLGLMEKSLGGGDQDRLDNLRVRIHEKERQLRLVEEELKEITTRLDEVNKRLQESDNEREADQ
jgi:chromosome segregation ATPase